jgi:hypothetical protein
MIRGNFKSPEGGSFRYLCQALRPDMYVLTNNPSFNCQLWLDGDGTQISIDDYVGDGIFLSGFAINGGSRQYNLPAVSNTVKVELNATNFLNTQLNQSQGAFNEYIEIQQTKYYIIPHNDNGI